MCGGEMLSLHFHLLPHKGQKEKLFLDQATGSREAPAASPVGHSAHTLSAIGRLSPAALLGGELEIVQARVTPGGTYRGRTLHTTTRSSARGDLGPCGLLAPPPFSDRGRGRSGGGGSGGFGPCQGPFHLRPDVRHRRVGAGRSRRRRRAGKLPLERLGELRRKRLRRRRGTADLERSSSHRASGHQRLEALMGLDGGAPAGFGQQRKAPLGRGPLLAEDPQLVPLRVGRSLPDRVCELDQDPRPADSRGHEVCEALHQSPLGNHAARGIAQRFDAHEMRPRRDLGRYLRAERGVGLVGLVEGRVSGFELLDKARIERDETGVQTGVQTGVHGPPLKVIPKFVSSV